MKKPTPEIDFDTIDWEANRHLLEEQNSDVMERAWRTDIGRRWAVRNPTTVEGTDQIWSGRYGRTKSWLVRDALRSVPPDTRWLEVGCAAGAHMRVLNAVGHHNVVGVDMNLEGMADAPTGMVAQSRARQLPFADRSVDGVTTSGTLIHLGPPDRLKVSIAEVVRVSRRWLFFVELWAAKPTVLIFEDALLPPAWVYPWNDVLPPLLPGWKPRHCELFASEKSKPGDASRIVFVLMERA